MGTIEDVLAVALLRREDVNSCFVIFTEPFVAQEYFSVSCFIYGTQFSLLVWMNASLQSSNQCKSVRKEQKLINTYLFGWCRVWTERDRSSLLSFLRLSFARTFQPKAFLFQLFQALSSSDKIFHWIIQLKMILELCHSCYCFGSTRIFIFLS